MLYLNNFCWRITKYNPQYRNSHDIFLQDEWTSYADIGKIFDTIKLTYEEYAHIENLYIKAIQSFMQCHNISSLQITTLESPATLDSDIHDTDAMINLFNSIKNNDWISQNNIENLCKLILRDKLWGKLIYNKQLFIHFGWDFYMYIGSSLSCAETISTIQNSGLFVEPFKSPYQTIQ
ncbi:MAG TPA: hypothetical protein VHX42_03000 [Candidatus Babeliales bacterium]|jgi:hypothetical protein|nr:hypothetical protein [Candidatus Babeliales bacterium]